MKLKKEGSISANHPLRHLFRDLTDRALCHSSTADRDLLLYLTDLLVDFVHVDHFYRLCDEEGRRLRYVMDMLQQANGSAGRRKKRVYKQIGDYTLFLLGMFPESLSYGRSCIPQSFYADTGRRSYLVASELERDADSTVVFRKMADKYEQCVLTLNWIREYTHDPFYQYMLRQFGVTC